MHIGRAGLARTTTALAVMALGLVAAGCGKAGITDAQAVKGYQEAARHLSPRNPKPDQALQTLYALRRNDPQNGFTDYLIAAAHSRKGDMSQAMQSLRKGNQARRCLHYHDEGPFPLFPGYAVLRQFARESVAAAPRLGTERGAALLQEIRVMAKRVAGGTREPQIIPVLVGSGLRKTVDGPLVALYEQAGMATSAAAARQLKTADERWAEQNRSRFRSAGEQTDMAQLLRKHGFTPRDREALNQGGKPPPQTQRKIEAMGRDMAAIEKPVALAALKTMPD